MFYFKALPLFNFIKDWPQSLNEATSNLYAEDPDIYYQHKNIQQTENVLNKGFTSLCEWFSDNKLSTYFWENNTKSILFTRSKTSRKLNISDVNHSIKRHDCVEYLGCILHNTSSGKSVSWKFLEIINATPKPLYRQGEFWTPVWKRVLCNAPIQPHC